MPQSPKWGLLALVALALSAGCVSTPPPSRRTTVVASVDPAKAEAVRQLIRERMEKRRLRAVLVRVTIDGQEILTEAFGESMAGVPATTDMHFRNGAVSIAFTSTLLLQLVDQQKVKLTDRLSTWLPDVPNADRVTLGQLAQMTSGYADYVRQPEFITALYANPFRQWHPDELLALAVSKPLFFEPGTNWAYAHTNYVLLGLALERITGRPVNELMQERVLGPLGLTHTTDPGTPAIPEPVLHAFTEERREFLQLPESVPFEEDSSFWNPSWSINRGAIQTTDLFDLHDSAVAIGTGSLLSKESYAAMVSTALRGKTTALPGCPTCFAHVEQYTYGLGLITSGRWLLQNPMFGGYGAIAAYLPSEKAAVAVAVTLAAGPLAEGESPRESNEADRLFREIGALVAPSDPPPPRR